MTGVRAVFTNSANLYHEVAWLIQMAGSDSMSPRPAVFCGFQHDDPDSDAGFTLPLTNDEEEVATIHSWAGQAERRLIEVEFPSARSEVPGLMWWKTRAEISRMLWQTTGRIIRVFLCHVCAFGRAANALNNSSPH